MIIVVIYLHFQMKRQEQLIVIGGQASEEMLGHSLPTCPSHLCLITILKE